MCVRVCGSWCVSAECVCETRVCAVFSHFNMRSYRATQLRVSTSSLCTDDASL